MNLEYFSVNNIFRSNIFRGNVAQWLALQTNSANREVGGSSLTVSTERTRNFTCELRPQGGGRGVKNHVGLF